MDLKRRKGQSVPGLRQEKREREGVTRRKQQRRANVNRKESSENP